MKSSDAVLAPRLAAVSKAGPSAAVIHVAKAPAWLNPARFALALGQFTLLILVFRAFDLADVAFARVAVLAWVGFIIHHFLKARWRLPFFAGLSLLSVVAALGLAGVPVLGVGLALIALCHLPIAFRLRCLLLLAACAGLALVRASVLRWTLLDPLACAVVASFFMFRLITYLYDLRHRAAPVGPARAIAYFFMLPNACFPLFPVVDYKTFCATHFNDDPFRIYQRGLQWMLRGIIQLLLYRLVCQMLQVTPYEVSDLGGVARFMVTTFLLYLRVSGSFHLVVGILHLFGFNLPETHHRYLLASNFLDLWRRINIYWKDFILKVFFNPAYFRCKRLGPAWAMALATFYAFFATWLLHTYQLFWLRGSASWTWQDAVFWWVLAVLVLVNALWESRRGRARALGAKRRTFRSEAGRVLCVLGTFLAMCVLWTIWSCQSADELLVLLKAATHVTPLSVAAILTGIAVLIVATLTLGRSPSAAPTLGWRSVAAIVVPAVGLLLLHAAPVPAALEDNLLGEMLRSVRQNNLSPMEKAELLRGYYEDLDGQNAAVEDEGQWPARQYHRFTHDFMVQEALPNTRLIAEGRTITINRWGMRDRDYPKAKPPGVYRIAVLGSSTETGWGVSDDEIYLKLLENRLNQDDLGDLGDGIRRYEVLNFAVAGHGGFQKLCMLERAVLAFDPDVVFFVSYLPETARTVDSLPQTLRYGYEIPEVCREDILGVARAAGVEPSMSLPTIRQRLRPYAQELANAVFQRFAERCRQHHVRACVVYRQEPDEYARRHARYHQQIVDLARAAGLPVLDLHEAYEKVENRDSLMVAPPGGGVPAWTRKRVDFHPSALGHRLLAEELYRQLHTDEGRAFLKPARQPAKP